MASCVLPTPVGPRNIKEPMGFVGSFNAGYPLKIGGKFILKIDNSKKIVFLASPEPKTSEEKNWARASGRAQKSNDFQLFGIGVVFVIGIGYW